jgi:hypothetical protein
MNSRKRLTNDFRNSVSFRFEASVPDSNVRISVRPSTKDDLPLLFKLEASAWSPEQKASDATIKARFDTHPAGFLIAENIKTGESYGFVFLVPISKFDQNEKLVWQNYADLSVVPQLDHSCPYRYGVSLAVATGAPKGIGTIILKAAANWCAFLGVKKFAWGARIPKFKEAFNKGTNIQDYFKGMQDGSVREEVIGVALGSGGKIVRPLPDYYDDPDSMNFGILVIHDL